MHLRKQIEVELDRLVEREISEPVNNALCAFPTVNVVKQSGSVRICGDFKPLNKFMMVDQHLIPHLSDHSVFSSEGKNSLSRLVRCI